MVETGSVAIVTGAGGGVGLATVGALAAAGFDVVCVDIDAAAAERAAASVCEGGRRAEQVVVDVSTEEGAEAMHQAALDAFGRVDLLHNNAALTDPQTMMSDLDLVRVPVDVFDHILAVNLRGPFLGCKAVIPTMVRQGSGTIINTSSVYSLMGDAGLAGYSASKGGLNSLTRHVATAYGRAGIRCNALVLGAVNTSMMQMLRDTPVVQGFLAGTLVGRLIEPAEVGAAVVFLASDAAVSITGQVIPLDGGHTSHVPWWNPQSSASVLDS